MANASNLRINVPVLKKVDPYVNHILETARHVTLYRFGSEMNMWEKTDIDGTLFVYDRDIEPYYGIVIMNRLNGNHFVDPVTYELEIKVQDSFLFYRNEKCCIYGIWFYVKAECARIASVLDSSVKLLKKRDRASKIVKPAHNAEKQQMCLKFETINPDIHLQYSKDIQKLLSGITDCNISPTANRSNDLPNSLTLVTPASLLGFRHAETLSAPLCCSDTCAQPSLMTPDMFTVKKGEWQSNSYGIPVHSVLPTRTTTVKSSVQGDLTQFLSNAPILQPDFNTFIPELPLSKKCQQPEQFNYLTNNDTDCVMNLNEGETFHCDNSSTKTTKIMSNEEHPNIVNGSRSSAENDKRKEVNDQLHMLWEMFPNLHPTYLQRVYNKMSKNKTFYDIISSLVNDVVSLSSTESSVIEVPSTSKAVHTYGLFDSSVSSEEDIQGSVTSNVQPEADVAAFGALDKIALEEQCQTLVKTLPNSDPDYLRELCNHCKGDPSKLQNFIIEILEGKKSCPTRIDAEKRKEIENARSKFLENFDVKEFLEVFPEPEKYFTDTKRVVSQLYKDHALSYLKFKYRSSKNLSQKFKDNNYLLYPTVKLLETHKGKSRRRSQNFDFKSPEYVHIPFFHEVAFIENQERIFRYLREKEVARKYAFDLAKTNNELLVCECCFDDECLAEDMGTCVDGHLFCQTCIRSGAEVQIGESKTVFPCLGTDCNAEFSLSTLQSVLKPTVFSRAVQRRQLEEVKAAGIQDLEICPFCDFATILPRGDKIFRCQNQECMKESCRLCKEPNHVPLRCDEVEKENEVKVRTYIENKMTEALVRTCWKCQKRFFKDEGCNKMRCPCGAMMCYLCRQPVKDYYHFVGEAASNVTGKCPLFSDNDLIHAEDVKKSAEEAKTEVLAQNPDVKLKHDPTKLLPTAPKRPKPMGHQFHFPPANIHGGNMFDEH